MAHWLQSTVQGMLKPATANQSIPALNAEFSKSGDVRNSWKQVIKSAKDEIVMHWKKWLNQF